jgi:dienelactone hydrolase
VRPSQSGLLRAAAVLTAAAVVFGVTTTADAAKKKSKKKRSRVEPTAVPRPPDPNRVTLTTPDGVALAATWRPVPGQPNAPAVLLVHDFARERRVFLPVEEELLARGLASLALELRAHGESTHKGKTVLKLAPRFLTDPNAFPMDVETACRWLRSRARTVGVLGLSLGGNLEVLATANGWADAGVAVSASAERLVPLAGSRSRSAKGTLFLAAERDADRAKSAQALASAALEPKKTLIVAGAAHGFALLQETAAKKAAYDWLVERLGVTPPTPTPTPVLVPAESRGFEPPPTATPPPPPTRAPTIPPLPTATVSTPTPELPPFGDVVPPSASPAATPRTTADAAAHARWTGSAAREARPQQPGRRA